ncbi:CU044_5270 family protein [Frigoribacterium sp. CFBP 8766]|uniref:CU044_5270 family protein n=1 Tax=Frigoribacterium sp. CFBP 8766 TaxID=2775273 RepID=UPI001784DEC4|nr:CU044_5270 family protein [Frigoribacterium sp. CFBP 8766]MBD8586057.1 CU044_5270 family protein [Frigoribacterium sp. CFBP 8766]
MRDEFAPPVGSALEEAITPIRRATFKAVTDTRHKARRRFVSLSVVAAVAAGALVAGSATGFWGTSTGGASAEAAALLNQAASSTIETSDFVVGPGEYLKVTTKEVSISFSGVGEADDPEKTVASLNPRTSTVYIPYDRESGVWVKEQEWPKPTVFFGSRGGEKALAEWASRPGAGLSQVMTGPGGHLAWTNAAGLPQSETLSSYDFSDLPRNPADLLSHFGVTDSMKSPSATEKAYAQIGDLLRQGDVPADLRAAAYKALAALPGVEVVSRSANLDGRLGVAFALTTANGSLRDELLVDPESGLFIGERSVSLEASEIVPAGTAWESTSIETSVSSTAP